MSTERRERRIAAILSADIAGYSRLMEIDESGTHARVAALQEEIIDPLFSSHRGRVFKQMGDGFLVEFDSVVDAIDCAIALQTALQEKNKDFGNDQQIKLRIGINLGDVIVEEDDRYGEGVILAARLQSQAEPGGILISQPAFLQLSSSQKAMFEDRGQRSLKNITMAVQVYGWTENARPPAKTRRGPIPIMVGGAILACAAVIGFTVLQFLPAGSAALPPLPTGPKIAIVPFETLSEDDESARLATSLSKSISADMSKFTDLFLLPLNATRGYQRTGFTPQQLHEDLGADYVLEGNLWRSDRTLRVTALLTNAREARLVWSQTYDGDLTAGNIFEVLDEITAGVVATVGTRSGVVRLQEAGRIRANRTENLTAYECVALYDYHGINVSRTDRGRVRDCLEKAVELDPNYAQAWSHLAGILIETYKNEKFSKADAQALLDRADAAAKRATELDNANAEAYYRRAVISQLRGEGYAAFKELADKALALNPNDADVIGDLGNFSYYSGDLERGKELVGRMMKINPRYPSWAHFVFFLDHFRNDEFPEALAEVVKITLPNHCFIQWSKAAAYGKVGDTANGRATLDHISKIEPPCPDDPRLPYRTRGLPEDLVASFMDGLRKAGMDVPPDDQ
ncbi:adenylate/guanylate cyclase domain-containing protein [Aestuariivita boseongensis]|uniref:adenylate/guanylate cyclase domain-containing protein n=1 Tax=Aestuariivita boseongensis TaxID=1470562 RepID=UPI000683052E|nr:adenylate/guanylate cyclase domain-containing protein [Aestuariivita boseongensis]